MSEKKNIDRLFQEKFKDFDAAPPERIWQNIEAELKEKKKKRVLPLWFRLSGVAALLLIGLLITMPLFNGNSIEDNTNNPVVIDNATNKNPVEPSLNTPANGGINSNNAITNTESNANNNTTVNTTPVTVAPASTGNGNNQSVNNTTVINSNKNIPAYNSNAVVSNNNNTDSKNRAPKNAILDARPKKSGNTKGNTTTTTTEIATNSTTKAAAKTTADVATITSKQNEAVAYDNEPSSSNSIKNNAGAIALTKEGKNADDLNSNGTIAENNASDAFTKNIALNEAIAETTIDTASVLKEENELEKLLKEKELGKDGDKTAVAENNRDRWSIKPQMAPLFYNSLSQGSPIDPELAANSKQYNNDISYGVGIDYAINDRISIRSGINTVNLGYSTSGIEFYPDLKNKTRNIAQKSKVANIVVQNQRDTPASGFNSEMAKQKFNGSMEQKMGYIEVPFEMSYKLLDNKFGINLIGGVSTLFLNENNVSVVSTQGYSSDIGKAENLNTINFSTNVGIGFKYRFLKSFEANFEPMFKYQVNTFSSDAGNFKPYFIGLYSGISFKF